ncbi:hypothetical protein [Legionella maioricensis]|nr:hypothetical protein [Legionella maioricensis]MCL9689091.1 hypothetical protein [Legionella maioricensis]
MMTKTLEELRKIINEQDAALMVKAQQQQLSIAERQAFELLRTRLSDEEGMDQLPPVDTLQKMYKPTPSFGPKSVNEKVLAAIIADFEEQFGKEHVHGECMCFPDNVAANDFFQKQANKGRAFLEQEVNKDNYAFSDGEGHYLMGSKDEINSYCEKNSLKSPFNPEKSSEHDYSPVIAPQ